MRLYSEKNHVKMLLNRNMQLKLLTVWSCSLYGAAYFGVLLAKSTRFAALSRLGEIIARAVLLPTAMLFLSLLVLSVSQRLGREAAFGKGLLVLTSCGVFFCAAAIGVQLSLRLFLDMLNPFRPSMVHVVDWKPGSIVIGQRAFSTITFSEFPTRPFQFLFPSKRINPGSAEAQLLLRCHTVLSLTQPAS